MNTFNAGGSSKPSGMLRSQVTRDLGTLIEPAPTAWTLRNWMKHRRREIPRQFAVNLIGRIAGVVHIESSLQGAVYRRPVLDLVRAKQLRMLLEANVDVRELVRYFGGHVTDYGVLSTRQVTDAGVAFLVDAFQNLTEVENFKFHGYGTGVGAEAAGNTALGTELTTQYVSDNVRPTGSQTEGASANIYRSVGTLSPDSGGTIAITEHGLFSASAAGTLWDRSVFSAINLVAGADSLQTTYDATFPSGG